jgi:hypothetical protein
MRWPGEREVVAAGFVPVRLLLRRAAALWLPAAVAATVLAGTGYGLVQQMLRSGANDPQIQVAHDAAERLASGAAPSDVASGALVNLATSLDVTVGVFDAKGQALASTARLDNEVPHPPTAALTAAQSSGQNVVTWQPRLGVRQAAVIVPFASSKGAGYVVAARSLRLIEQREDDALTIAALGWLLTLGCAAAAAVIASRLWLTSPAP